VQTAKIAVVPHGLDLRAYPARTRPRDAKPVILAVGQFKPRKGLAELVAACRALRDEGVDFACRIVGDGPERATLADAIRTFDLTDVVELRGARPHDEVLQEYEEATVFALPCVEGANGDVDGIPNVLIEAMASSLPVVSSDLPAIRELVTSGENGILVAPGDVAALAGALRRLFAEPDLRAALGEAGRRTVGSMFDAEVNAWRFAEVLWPGHASEPVAARSAS
jgi:glycosyltransferase involved in cell wall biosynthesis